MTGERIEHVREQLKDRRYHMETAIDAGQAISSHFAWRSLQDADELLDEVDRLRAGIEEMADEAEDAWNTTGWWAARRLRALLNPTEGDD